MNSGKSTHALVESGILTGAAVILMLISIYIPVIAYVTLFIWPLPITLIYIRHNIKYSILSLITCALITAMFSEPITALCFTVMFGIMSVVMGYCVKTKKSANTTLLYMGITNFICIIAVFYMFNLIMGQNLIEQFRIALEEGIKMIKALYTDIGMPKETIEKTLALFDTKTMIMLIPGTLVMGSGFSSLITYNFGKFLFKKLGYSLNEVVPFSKWYMPFKIAMGMMLFIVIGYILRLKQLGIGESLILNAMSVFRLTFVIIGLSSIAFFLKKKNVPKGIAVVIIVFIAFSPLINIIEIIGLIDYAFDLRKLDKNRVKFNRPQ
jgi:uncharacterized protein YybS (DUF2232 family)